MLAACTGRGERLLPDRSVYPGRCSNGRYCAVSGGYTALNRITDVIRVASPRITLRLYAIAPKRSAAAKGNGTRGSSARCGGRWERLARAPAAARSSSRALSRWPRWLRSGSPRRRSGRAGPLRWPGPPLSQRPPPLSALRGPVLARTGPGWPRSSGAAAGCNRHLRPLPGPVAGPARPIATQGGPLRGPRPRPSRPAGRRPAARRSAACARSPPLFAAVGWIKQRPPPVKSAKPVGAFGPHQRRGHQEQKQERKP